MRSGVQGVILLLLVVGCNTSKVTDPIPEGVIKGSGRTVGYGELKEEWRGEIVQLSWEPRAYLLKGFLEEEECEHLKKMAKPSMTKSTVVDNNTGKSIPSEIRTSTGTFLDKAADKVVAQIEKRVAQVTMLSIDHQEGLQILQYVNGQEYQPHFDYFHDDLNTQDEFGGQRIITVLMYLATPTKGGETVFPNAKEKVSGPEWSDCAKKGLGVKVYKGDAVMFYSLKPDGSKDATSLHGSCPTLEGEKWSATKWIHVLPFGGSADGQKQKWAGCFDFEKDCRKWAASGECDTNKGYMRKMCKKSCKICSTAS